MSILKYIMSPFVEFKEKAETSKEARVQDSRQTNSADVKLVDVLHTEQTYTTPTSTNPDENFTLEEYHKHFNALIEEANAKNPLFQGTDFKEFMDSKIDVEAIADEATKYRTAFNVLKRTGLTKERLVITGREYIKLIENDVKGFNAAFTQQYKTEIEQKEELLQKKANELQSLNDKISILNKEIKQMSQEIIKSKDHLNTNKTSFILAAENKKTEIENELQKIDHYFS